MVSDRLIEGAARSFLAAEIPRWGTLLTHCCCREMGAVYEGVQSQAREGCTAVASVDPTKIDGGGGERERRADAKLVKARRRGATTRSTRLG